MVAVAMAEIMPTAIRGGRKVDAAELDDSMLAIGIYVPWLLGNEAVAHVIGK
jgi:hypothetical protein